MNEIDIYIELAGFMNKFSGNTMAAFRNILAHPVHFEGDMRVALVEIIFPTSIKNITTFDVFHLHTQNTNWQHSCPKRRSRAVIEREDWSDNAKFEAGEYRTISSILEKLD